jgi:hypothetical protein
MVTLWDVLPLFTIFYLHNHNFRQGVDMEYQTPEGENQTFVTGSYIGYVEEYQIT